MTNKQSYIIHPTIKKNIKTNCFCRERLINEDRVNNKQASQVSKHWGSSWISTLIRVVNLSKGQPSLDRKAPQRLRGK
jgi:hypothetical protein